MTAIITKNFIWAFNSCCRAAHSEERKDVVAVVVRRDTLWRSSGPVEGVEKGEEREIEGERKNHPKETFCGIANSKDVSIHHGLSAKPSINGTDLYNLIPSTIPNVQ